MGGSDAFISYSHHADGDLAPALEAGLQRLAKPWNQRRAMEVFLDQQDLSASPHLWSSIVVALDDSEWFVLLASPGSAGSTWVGQEIAHWLSVPERRERMLIVLTAGKLQWADGDFTKDSDAAHDALRGAFEEEPLYVDMTQVDRSITLDLRNPLFKERVATLAATIRRTTVGNLIGEDTRQFQRARRLRRIAVGALAVLTVGAVVASVVAVLQRGEAQSQRLEAVLQRNEALRQKSEAEAQKATADKNAAESRARELAGVALDTMSDDPVLATLVAVEANYPNGAAEPIDVAEARTTLGVTLRNVQGATLVKVGPRITAPTTNILRSGPQQLVTLNLAAGTVDLAGERIPPLWWDAVTGEQIETPVSDAEVDRMMAPFGSVMSADSAISVTPVAIGVTPVSEPLDLDDDATVVAGVDAATGELVVESLLDQAVIARLAVPPDTTFSTVAMMSDRRVAAVAHSGQLFAWDVAPGALPRRIDTDLYISTISAIDDHRVVVEGYQGTADPLTGAITSDFDLHLAWVLDLARDGFDLFETYLENPPFLRDGSVTMSSDGSLVAGITVGDGLSQPVVVWDLATGEELTTIDSVQAADATWLDGRTLAIASTRGVEQYRLTAAAEVTSGSFSAVDAWAGGVVLRRSDSGEFDQVSGSLADSTLPTGGVEFGAVNSPLPGSIDVERNGGLVAALRYEVPPDGFIPRPVGVVVRARDSGLEVASYQDGRGMAFDSRGGRLAVGLPNSIVIVDTSSWLVVDDLPVDGYTPSQLMWTNDDRQLIANGIDESLGGDRHLDVLDVENGTVVSRGPSSAIAMALSSDGSLLAVGRDGGEVQLLRVGSDGTLSDPPVGVMVADLSKVSGLSFSPDGALLVTSGVRSTIVWDVRVPAAPRQVQVVSDLPAWTFGGVQESDVVGAPTTAKGSWGLASFRPDGASFVLAGGSGAVELPDFDPALACRSASAADIARLEALLGSPSACLRVAGLMN